MGYAQTLGEIFLAPTDPAQIESVDSPLYNSFAVATPDPDAWNFSSPEEDPAAAYRRWYAQVKALGGRVTVLPNDTAQYNAGTPAAAYAFSFVFSGPNYGLAAPFHGPPDAYGGANGELAYFVAPPIVREFVASGGLNTLNTGAEVWAETKPAWYQAILNALGDAKWILVAGLGLVVLSNLPGRRR